MGEAFENKGVMYSLDEGGNKVDAELHAEFDNPKVERMEQEQARRQAIREGVDPKEARRMHGPNTPEQSARDFRGTAEATKAAIEELERLRFRVVEGGKLSFQDKKKSDDAEKRFKPFFLDMEGLEPLRESAKGGKLSRDDGSRLGNLEAKDRLYFSWYAAMRERVWGRSG